MLNWFDSHIHINDIIDINNKINATDILNNKNNKYLKYLNICTSVEQAKTFEELIQKNSSSFFTDDNHSTNSINSIYSIYYSVGLHPWFANDLENINQALFDLKNYLADYFKNLNIEKNITKNIVKLIAIGEIGLDCHSVKQQKTSKILQLYLMTEQLKLAAFYNLPVIIHAQGYLDEILALLKKYHIQKAIFHGFAGSIEQALQIIAAAYMLGIGAVVFNTQSAKAQKMLQNIPLHAILLETDVPYINFKNININKNINEGINVVDIAKAFVDLRNLNSLNSLGSSDLLSLEDLSKQLSKNAETLFSIKV